MRTPVTDYRVRYPFRLTENRAHWLWASSENWSTPPDQGLQAPPSSLDSLTDPGAPPLPDLLPDAPDEGPPPPYE